MSMSSGSTGTHAVPGRMLGDTQKSPIPPKPSSAAGAKQWASSPSTRHLTGT